jgi:uncharacterized protein YdaU (DUF1376 family)
MYAGDWLADAQVRMLSLEERGAYMDLLCYQWREGSLPDDPVSLARMLGVTIEEFEEVWQSIEAFFEITEEGLKNPRMAEVVTAQMSKSVRLSNAGKKGARKRWQKQGVNGHANGQANGHPNGQSIANKSQSQRKKVDGATEGSSAKDHSPVRKKLVSHPAAETNGYPDWFDELWKAYPKRKGSNPKAGAWDRVRKLLVHTAIPDLIHTARAYAAHMQTTGHAGTRMVMQAMTFYGPQKRAYLDYLPGESMGGDGETEFDQWGE